MKTYNNGINDTFIDDFIKNFYEQYFESEKICIENYYNILSENINDKNLHNDFHDDLLEITLYKINNFDDSYINLRLKLPKMLLYKFVYPITEIKKSLNVLLEANKLLYERDKLFKIYG